MTSLRVGGFVPFTSTDFPGALAAVIFCQGCPWRCGYCQNPHLLPGRGETENLLPDVLDWLSRRKGLLDAVVFSGGEPTAQAALGGAMRSVRAMGFKIGLHTAGAYPRRLGNVLADVDWVGIDIKAPMDAYERLTGAAGSGKAAWQSLERIQRAGIDFEVRTTVHPTLTPPDTLARLAKQLAARGVTRWVVQPFRPTGCANADVVSTAGTTAVDEDLLPLLARHVPEIAIRA